MCKKTHYITKVGCNKVMPTEKPLTKAEMIKSEEDEFCKRCPHEELKNGCTKDCKEFKSVSRIIREKYRVFGKLGFTAGQIFEAEITEMSEVVE